MLAEDDATLRHSLRSLRYVMRANGASVILACISANFIWSSNFLTERKTGLRNVQYLRDMSCIRSEWRSCRYGQPERECRHG